MFCNLSIDNKNGPHIIKGYAFGAAKVWKIEDI